MIEVSLPDGTVAEFPEGTPPEVMKAAIQRRLATTGPNSGENHRIGVPRNAFREGLNARIDGYYGGRAPSTHDDAVNAIVRARMAEDPLAENRIQETADRILREELDPTRGMGAGSRIAAGAGMAISDTATGIQQIAGQVTPEEVEERRRLNAPLMATPAGFVGNVLSSAAQIAAPVPGSGSLRVLGRAAPYVGAAGRNATFAAAQPVADGESRGVNAAVAGAIALPAQAVANVTGRALAGSKSIDPQRRAMLDMAEREGIPVAAYQASTSPTIKRLGSVMAQFPGAGTRGAAEAQNEGFTRALTRSFGLESDTLEPAVISAARARLNAAYEDIWSRNSVTLDGGSVAKLGAISNAANRTLTTENAAVVQRQIQYLLEQARGGAMPGRVYQNLRGDLTGGDDAAGRLIKQVRKVLDGAAERSIGRTDAGALRLANSQYNNLRVVEDGLKQAAGAGNEISPARLWALINRQGRPRATPEMNALARLGQTVLKDPIPDSGTAGRIGVIGGLTGIAGLGVGTESITPEQAAMMVALGATGGRALNSNQLARMATRGLAPNRPVLIGLSRRLPPAVLPVAGTAYAEDR